MTPEDLVAALDALADAVAAVSFDLPGPQRGSHRRERDRVASDIGGHAARLRDLDAPLLVVVGGVTGAGKSTFVNTMVGRESLTTGPLRPTTSVPALVCHPSETGWFTSDRILPGLARVEAHADGVAPGGGDVLRLVFAGSMPPGLALVDSPDVDSIAEHNREVADALLDAADLWLWFTTAGKYADAESMRYLRRARERRTALAVVLALVHAADADEVVADFTGKLGREGLAEVTLFTIPVATVSGGRLPADVAAPVRDWLHSLAAPSARRSQRLATLAGAINALPAEVRVVVNALTDDLRTTSGLLTDVDRSYGDAVAAFRRALDGGVPLRSEVVSRWDRFVGGSRFLKSTEAATSQARTWVKQLLTNVGLAEEQRLERQVRIEVADQVTDVAGRIADLASADVVGRWSATPIGRGVLSFSESDLARRSPGFDERAQAAVKSWQAAIAERVATVGAQRRTQARVVSGAISVAATSAILVVLAHAGLTGAEAGIAAAAGAANQGLLVKLLGEANLRRLVAEARQDLVERFDELLATDRHRFRAVLADAAPDQEQLAALEEALEAVTAAAPAVRALQP